MTEYEQGYHDARENEYEWIDRLIYFMEHSGNDPVEGINLIKFAKTRRDNLLEDLNDL